MTPEEPTRSAMTPEEEYEFYSRPENLAPRGLGRRRGTCSSTDAILATGADVKALLRHHEIDHGWATELDEMRGLLATDERQDD